jgi:Kef-type K+ transport system membrane component KefB
VLEIERLIDGLESGLINPFSVTVLLFLAALLSAEVTVRLAHVPRIVSLVVAGAAIGWLRSVNATASLMPLPRSFLEVLALVLIFEVGQRVPLSWLGRNPWLLVTSLAESSLSFVCILSMLVLAFRIPMVESVFVSVICMTSSPIVVMCVSKDLAARGQIAERALLLSTLSSVYGVLGMEFLLSGYLAANHADLARAMEPLIQLFGSFALGTLAAGVLRLYVLLTDAAGAVLTIGIVCLCLLLYAAAPRLGISPVLASLSFGLMVRATDRTHRLLAHQTSEAGVMLSIGYFVVLGASFRWVGSAATVAIAFAISTLRIGAKVVANSMLARPAALHADRGALVGLALAPLSSLALLLAASLSEHAGLERASDLAAMVIFMMAVAGPLLTELALRRAKEPTRQSG